MRRIDGKKILSLEKNIFTLKANTLNVVNILFQETIFLDILGVNYDLSIAMFSYQFSQKICISIYRYYTFYRI